jgi:hypothetical protein
MGTLVDLKGQGYFIPTNLFSVFLLNAYFLNAYFLNAYFVAVVALGGAADFRRVFCPDAIC